jgi:hypothetical protein
MDTNYRLRHRFRGKFVDPGMRIERGYQFLSGELTKAGTATKRPTGKSG